MNKRASLLLILAALVCCGAMALVDGVLQPGYGVKSLMKVCLFLLVPALLCRVDGDISLGGIFRFPQKGVLTALALGLGLFALIFGGYFLVRPFFDFSAIAGSLTATAGITRENFLYVSLYISFANSLLEEFFFRGFLFTNLKRTGSRPLAYGFSALVFSLYHAAMMTGWFSHMLLVLVLAGLFMGGLMFNYLNEKLDTVLVSWGVHMFANFAINAIGFMLL